MVVYYLMQEYSCVINILKIFNSNKFGVDLTYRDAFETFIGVVECTELKYCTQTNVKLIFFQMLF